MNNRPLLPFRVKFPAIAIPLASLFMVCGITPVSALQGGPVMPEYVKFEPPDITDIVNMSSGDFTYSIPLGDVPGPAGGFPISMSYHAGVGHQQEATWVGLGWTLNPGAINRMLRGFPDDIHNSAHYSYIYAREYKSGWGVNVGAGYGPVGLNMTYESGKGFGGSVSLMGIQAGPASMGVEIGTNGVSLSAQIGMIQASVDKTGATASIGYSSPGALSASMSLGIHAAWGGRMSTVGGVGLGVRPMPGNASTTLAGYSFSSASSGASVSIAGTGFASGSSGNGQMRQSFESKGFGGTIPLPNGFWVKLGYSHYEQEMRISDANIQFMNGYMYQGGQGVQIHSYEEQTPLQASPLSGAGTPLPKFSNFIYKDASPSLENLELSGLGEKPAAGTKVGQFPGAAPLDDYWMSVPSYDVYSASGPGLGGSFRPYGKKTSKIYQVFDKLNAEDKFPAHKNFMLAATNVGGQGWKEQARSVFSVTQESESLREISRDDLLSYPSNEFADYPDVDYSFCQDGHVSWSKVNGSNADRDEVAEIFNSVNSQVSDGCSPYGFLKSNLINEGNRFVYSADDHDRYRVAAQTNMRFGFMNDPGEFDKYAFDDTLYWSYGGRQIIPLLESGLSGNPEDGGRIRGFKIIDSDGKQYLYEQPVYSLLQVDYTTSEPKKLPSFRKNGEEKFSWNMQVTPYATQWLLTEIRGADFIKVSDADMSQNYGYQIKLSYTEPVQFNWRSPYALPNADLAHIPNLAVPGSKEKFFGSMGQKELVYLKSIESATHKAVFNLNSPDVAGEERQDSREWKTAWMGNSTTPVGPPLEVPVTLEFDYNEQPGAPVVDGPWEGGNLGRGNVLGPTYNYDVNYESRTAYLPFRPTPSQQKQILEQGIELSGFSAAFNYFRHHPDCDFFGCPDILFVIAGPAIKHEPTEAYTHYDVTAVTPTIGNEEQFGPYKITFPAPIASTSAFKDIFEPGALHDLHKGKVFLGQIGFWQVEDRLRTLKARFRPPFTRELNDWEGGTDYAESNAPIPPKMRIGGLYAHTSAKNQARYLKSIDVVRKNSGQKLRSFDFQYDYSLCDHTPNSFSSVDAPSGYPSDPFKLSGKLTLQQVTEKGYVLATGVGYPLPPYEFRYQTGNTHPAGNPHYYDWQATSTSSDEFNRELAASELKVDPFGLYNEFGDDNDQKVRNSGNAGVVWNLEEIKNPLGGILKIDLERDRFRGPNYGIDNPATKPQLWQNATSSTYITDDQGYIRFHELFDQEFVDYWDFNGAATDRSRNYFGDMTLAEAQRKYWPTLDNLHADEEIIVVLHSIIHYESDGGTPLTGHLYFTVTTTVRASTGPYLTINLKPEHMPNLQSQWRYHRETLGGSSVGSVDRVDIPIVAIYRKSDTWVFGGDTRVSNLKSCFTDCKTTQYIYEDGAIATRPDSALSNDWISKNLFGVHPRPKYIDEFRDFAGMKLGKNAWGTRGEENDLPFLPPSSVLYPKVTVLNVPPSGIPNGKTEYTFYTAKDLASNIFPIPQHATSSKMWNTSVYHPTRDGVSVSSLKYHDFTSILGKPKSVTYYGAQVDAGVTKYFMITKDSTEYGFGRGVEDDWESERNYSGTSNQHLEHLVLGAYSRYPVRIVNQVKYQFAKKVFEEPDVADVDHLKTEIINSEFDPLTGTVTSSFVKYNDGANPQVVKNKETSVHLMSELGASAAYPIPEEMRRRNMLIQPFSEEVKVYSELDRDNTEKTLDYKLSVWSATNLSNLKTGTLFKQGDMVPTFALPVPSVPGELGSPSLYYSTGYNLGKWNGALVQKVDRFSHASEVKMPTGTYASSYFSEEGFTLVGYALNSKRNQSQMATLNADPTSNLNWVYGNGASWRNGNFLFQKSSLPPVVSRVFPITAGETYQVQFRAKSRTSNANFSVDFISSFTAIIGGIGSIVTQEGPQANFTITPAWNIYTATLAVTASTYTNPPGTVVPISPFALNQLRFFNDASANNGLEYDIILDYVKISRTPVASASKTFEDWKLWQIGSFMVSNPNAIYSSSTGTPSVLQAPLDISAVGKDLYSVEFRARANVLGTLLQVDFLCGSGSGTGCEGDQKSVSLTESWKKFKVTLDRRIYPNTASYTDNWLRFFCDSQADREIEMDYVRAYPEGALVNSFIQDSKGNAIETIDENNVSAYYLYDAFGKLTGMRTDPGFIKSEQSLNYGKK